jgi:hypothetical protein
MGGRKPKYRSETETPPNSKLAINVTIERSLLDEMKRIHAVETKRAEEEDRSLPDWSNTCEMICRKGVKTYKKENPSAVL